MPKPKLPEQDKKEVVPLRLPPAVISAVREIAERWGEVRGKEIKAATVARELVLIGLGVVEVARRSKMLTELIQETEIIESVKNGAAANVEEIAAAVIRYLKTTRKDLFNSAPDEPIPIEPIIKTLSSKLTLREIPVKEGGKK